VADERAPVTREHRLAVHRIVYGCEPCAPLPQLWAEGHALGFPTLTALAQALADAERSYRLAAEERLDAITSRLESIRSALDENKLAEAWEAGYLAAERDGCKRLTQNPYVAKQPAEANGQKAR